MQLEPGAIIAGRFRLERPLSRGGMGSVWVARHIQLGHPVAVKFMDPKFAASPAFRARFEREARSAANLQSPHVVRVEDSGIQDGVPWLVMELLQGEDLETRLRRRGRIPLYEATRLLGQAAKALRRAHEAGLVHRDLKPGNLFLAIVEDEEVVKVLDFGIAKETGAKLAGAATQTGEILGSPFYMSPEQVRGDKELDARSDLWSLGVILFRAITGVLPFSGDQLGTVMAKILVDPIPLARQVAPDLPPAMDGFFARAFARDRAQRFQSIREMMDELSRILGAPRPAMGSTSDVVPLPAPVAAPFVMAPLPARPTAPTMPLRGSADQEPGPPSAAAAPASTAPTGTLTSASGVTEGGAVRAGRSKAPWLIAAAVLTITLTGLAGFTISRLVGSAMSEPAAISEPASTGAPPSSAPTAEVPTVEATVEPTVAPAASSAPEITPSSTADGTMPAVKPTSTPTAAPTAAPTATAKARAPTETKQPQNKQPKWF